MLGLSAGTIGEVRSDSFNSDMAESYRQALPGPEDVKNMTDLQKAWADFEQTAEAAGQKLLSEVAPGLTAILNAVTKFMQDHPDLVKGIEGIGAGLTVAGAGSNAVALLRLPGKLSRAAAGAGGGEAAAATAAESSLLRYLGPVGAFLYGMRPADTQSQAADDQALTPEARAAIAAHSNRALTSKEQQARIFGALRYFTQNGWTPEQAAGIVGNLQQESSLNQNAGLGTAHVGLAQWSAERQAKIAAHFGKSVSAMSFEEQLQAIQWELTQGGYANVGTMLRSAPTAANAAKIIDRAYESPGNYDLEDARRGANAEAILRASVGDLATNPSMLAANSNMPGGSTSSVETNINGPITINTRATDAKGVAAGIGNELRRFNYAAQANSGLQ
jgi:hypothetical protein